MKAIYKGCEIEVTREKCLGGWDMVYFSVFDDGFEVTSGFTDSDDTVREVMKDMKELVDDYREHPEEYKKSSYSPLKTLNYLGKTRLGVLSYDREYPLELKCLKIANYLAIKL